MIACNKCGTEGVVHHWDCAPGTRPPAPALTAEERAVVERFEAAPVPADVVDAVVQRIASQYRDAAGARFAINDFRDWLDDHPVAALAPSPACGDLSPRINFGGDSDAERLMCELPVHHAGAHQHDNGDGLPPTRWVVQVPSPAEEAIKRVETLADTWETRARAYAAADDRDKVTDLRQRAAALRAALASPAPAPQGSEGQR